VQTDLSTAPYRSVWYGQAVRIAEDNPREKLLAASSELFYQRGINATGIDAVIANAKVAKASLYNNFAGKDDLVVAYLERMTDQWKVSAESVDDPKRSHQERVRSFFNSLHTSASRAAFNGCPFASAMAELPHNRKVQAQIKKYRDTFFAHLSAITGLPASSLTVLEIGVLYDGSMASVKLNQDPTPIKIAEELSVRLLQEMKQSL
jgi:AcrR family transcriptional regulator